MVTKMTNISMRDSEKSSPQQTIPNNFLVGKWLVQPKLNQISFEDNVQVLEPKLIKVLTYLAERPKQVVSREELIAALWQSKVSEGAVNLVIAILRKCLDDSTETPEYIQTIAKQGYRFIAPVSLVKPVKTFQIAKAVHNNYSLKFGYVP